MSYANGEEQPGSSGGSAGAERGPDAAKHEVAWGPLASYQGRRRADPSAPDRDFFAGFSRSQLVAVALALAAALGLVFMLVWNRQPAGDGQTPAGGAFEPGLPVVPTVDPGSAPDSASPSGPASHPPSNPPVAASPSVRPGASAGPTEDLTLFTATSYEAESPANLLSSGARVGVMSGASGGKGVYAIGSPNLGVLRFTAVAVPVTRTYTLTIYYQNDWRKSDRLARISVNGATPVWLRFSPTGGCCVATRTISVTLHAGTTNTIELSNPNERGPDIDRIVISG